MERGTQSDAHPAVHAILDIGSAGVGGALVLQEYGSAPRIIFTTRHTTVPRNPGDVTALLHAVTTGLQNTVADMAAYAKTASVTIAETHCICAAPWYTSTRSEHTETIAHGKHVTDAMLETVITNAFGKMEHGVQIPPMEQRVLQTTCNGYPVDTPVGTACQTLGLTTYQSVLSEKIRAQALHSIGAYWHVDTIAFHSYALTLTTAIRDFASGSAPSLTIIDISGEVTDILVVEAGVFVGSASFPHGSNMLIRTLMERGGCTRDEARSRLHRYMTRTDTEAARAYTAAVLEAVGFTWRRELQRTLDTLAADFVIPTQTYVAAAADMHTWYATAATNITPATMSVPLVVERLNAGMLGTMCKTERGVRFDLFLALATHYIRTYCK